MTEQTPLGKQERGFTIIELMIATIVLATILVLVSAMMIGIGQLYYKGINQARVQDTTRSIVDDVSQHLQLSGKAPVPEAVDDTTGDSTAIVVAPASAEPGYTIKAWCIDSTRYTYVLNRQIGTGTDTNGAPQLSHVLWRDTISAGVCTPADLRNPGTLSSTGTELMIGNSRLTDLTIGITSPYTLSVGVALGDIDLLNLNHADSTCKSDAGQQFCATSGLKTVVVRRITSSD
ncbi:MAG: hypothetical protein JWL89_727 [Candidatus Saccharibacteria bacterium]|nr:hypothetical protein [Candidatus Saccharibacteria bacterium]